MLHTEAPTFCANDLLALGLLQQTIDIEFAAAAAVPLTSVREPRQELGRTAAGLVMDEASNPRHAHQQVTFTPELVARASTLG